MAKGGCGNVSWNTDKAATGLGNRSAPFFLPSRGGTPLADGRDGRDGHDLPQDYLFSNPAFSAYHVFSNY